jgi:hypothetical protein
MIDIKAINSDTENLNSSDTWIDYMRRGHFGKAWEFSDKVLKSGINRDYEYLPRHYQCIWDGSSLHGKQVLIRCYHGLGDTIQFIRYAKLVKEIASEVIVWAQPSLIELLKTVNGVDQLLPLHEGTPEVEFDVDVEIMDLPHVFRTTITTIPAKVPYFNVNPKKLTSNEKLLKVGLVWQAGDWDQSRNVPFMMMKSFFEVKGIQIYILQSNPYAAGWERGMGTFPGEFNLYEYAQIVKSLDLLISVDSMPAHLAGALNIPVWLMLQAKADWRWMENRADSPWYPSMKIFRQKKQGEWKDVIVSITKELSNLIKK